MLTDQEIYQLLTSPSARHLLGQFSTLTPIQRRAIPTIIGRTPALLIAPTASGKTEAAAGPLFELKWRERWVGHRSILWVAPTRALVNDIYRRLQIQLDGYESIGRRTGEHHEPDCDILVTTPESFDSMLARGTDPDGNGRHLLNATRAIVLDELHLLAESARGTQLQILLERLDRVTTQQVLRLALSATVADADGLAQRFLGSGGVTLCVGGGRALRVDRRCGDGALPGRGRGGIDPMVSELWRSGCPEDVIAERLLSIRSSGDPLKALVFVPSRRRCDELAAALDESIAPRTPVRVLAHHGSLSQGHREGTEAVLTVEREAVVVATATLELGIDIGDVSLVVLEGPPSSVSSLLQRIGRANRRGNEVHVVPIARSLADACMLASMIRAAECGELDPTPLTAHYSVAIQQLASFFYQKPRARAGRDELIGLFAQAFGDAAGDIVDGLVPEWLESVAAGLLGPTQALREMMDAPLRLHSNIGAAGPLVPVIDASTGDPIAWVPKQPSGRRIVLAGGTYLAEQTPEAIEVHATRPSSDATPLRYAAKSAPLTRTALRHLALGLGLSDRALVRLDGQWVHFGGAVFGCVLFLLGVESGALSSKSDPRVLVDRDVESVIKQGWESLESFCGFGPLHRNLPRTLRKAAVTASVSIADFRRWLNDLEVHDLTPEQSAILEEVI